LESLLQNNKFSEIEASYSYVNYKGGDSEAYFKELVLALEVTLGNFKTEKSRILFEKVEEHNLRHQLEDEVNRLASAVKSLS